MTREPWVSYHDTLTAKAVQRGLSLEQEADHLVGSFRMAHHHGVVGHWARCIPPGTGLAFPSGLAFLSSMAKISRARDGKDLQDGSGCCGVPAGIGDLLRNIDSTRCLHVCRRQFILAADAHWICESGL